MPDHRFFNSPSGLSLKDIAAVSRAELSSGADPGFHIRDLAPLDKAGPQDLTFLGNVKYKDQFQATKAGACFVQPEMAQLAPKGLRLLFSSNPHKSYALAAQKFYPQQPVEEDISDKAHIHSSAQIGKGCRIEEGVVIRENAQIGDHCWIEAGSVIGKSVVLGVHCHIGANVTISHALIGNHVRLYPGVRVGQDGFGFAIDPKGHVKIPQLGRVIIGDSVEIGANTTIDRGAGPDTIIGQGTWIDNLVQIGHNVQIGRGCIIVAQAGVSGSTVIEDFVAIGGQAGVAGHLHIAKGARIAGQSGVMRNIPAGEEHMGTPSMPIKQFMRQIATLNRLIKREKSS